MRRPFASVHARHRGAALPAAHDDAPGIRFRALGDALGVYAQRHSPRNIISGAGEAFRAPRQWYLQGRSPEVGVSSVSGGA